VSGEEQFRPNALAETIFSQDVSSSGRCRIVCGSYSYGRRGGANWMVEFRPRTIEPGPLGQGRPRFQLTVIRENPGHYDSKIGNTVVGPAHGLLRVPGAGN